MKIRDATTIVLMAISVGASQWTGDKLTSLVPRAPPSPPRSPPSPHPYQRASSPGPADWPSPSTQILPPRIARMSRGPDRRRDPPRMPDSSGESDSSPEPREGVKDAKVKVRVVGPASVTPEGEQPREVPSGQKHKESFRGNFKANVNVQTHAGNPPGRATMTMRGQKWVDLTVDNHAGGHAKLKQTHHPSTNPLREFLLPHDYVEPGGRHWSNSKTHRYVTKIDGPGTMRGQARN